jgi:hypothetical protein
VWNDLLQSVLHLAARNCNEHPLMAAYIAEALEIHNKQHLLEVYNFDYIFRLNLVFHILCLFISKIF